MQKVIVAAEGATVLEAGNAVHDAGAVAGVAVVVAGAAAAVDAAAAAAAVNGDAGVEAEVEKALEVALEVHGVDAEDACEGAEKWEVVGDDLIHAEDTVGEIGRAHV